MIRIKILADPTLTLSREGFEAAKDDIVEIKEVDGLSAEERRDEILQATYRGKPVAEVYNPTEDATPEVEDATPEVEETSSTKSKSAKVNSKNSK